jgi:hypothetical protein
MVKHILLLVAFCSVSATALCQERARFSDFKAGMKDTYLERQAVRLANNRANDLKCCEAFTKAKILSSDWDLCFKGAKLQGRDIHIELYGQTHEGGCGVAHFIFQQRYEGRGYFSEKLKLHQMGDFYAAECE